jgi:hypothetical protein
VITLIVVVIAGKNMDTTMNKNIIMFALGAISAFMLSMTIAGYITVTADPPEHFAIHTRALNYTDKDCYTKTDVELIVFGKVLDYDKK